MHKRTEIRNMLVSILTGATAAGTNVFKNRVHRKGEEQLPSIVIRDDVENASPRDIAGRSYIRSWSVKLELTVEANEDYDTTLDNLCKQVEDLMSANPKLNGTANGVTYVSTEPNFDGSGQSVIGQALVTFQIQYLS